MTGLDYASALRAVADFYEAHPDIPTPTLRDLSVYGVTDTKEGAARIIEALKPCQKAWDDTFFKITRDFDGIILKFVFMREAVCTKRVVGTKLVPAAFIEAHEEEIVEWDCSPVLEGTVD